MRVTTNDKTRNQKVRKINKSRQRYPYICIAQTDKDCKINCLEILRIATYSFVKS